MPSAPRIALCGRLRVGLDGTGADTAVGGRATALAVAYLVLNRGHAVDRRDLTTAVWGDDPPKDPEHALRTLLYRLRKVLDSVIVLGAGTVHLELSDDVAVDVDEIANHLERAERALARGSWHDASDQSQAALAACDGGLLVGVEADWLDAWRTKLQRQGAAAMACLARASLELGGPAFRTAESSARNLIEIEPYRDSGHELLIRALAAQGDVGEALHAYETLRVMLRDELGAVPSPALRRLHVGLLDRRGSSGETEGRRFWMPILPFTLYLQAQIDDWDWVLGLVT